MPISAARLAAFRILLRVVRNQAHASELLHSHRLNSLIEKDQKLVTELVYGVLRQQNLLDWYLTRFSTTGLKRLDLEVLCALRLGAYQILFLTQIPVRSAVDQSVELVKRSRLKSAAGFTNAVLRKIKKEEFEAALTSLPLNSATDLSIRYSHPEWLVQRWWDRFGREQLIRLLEHNNKVPRAFFRLNTLDLSRDMMLEKLLSEGIAVRSHPFSQHIFQAVEGDISRSSLFRQAKIFSQDAGSQLLLSLLDVRPGHTCLDLCAAPGGKSSLIALLTRGEARVIATDLHWHRLRVARHLHGEKYPHLWFVSADAAQPLPFAAQFDRILLDAPCSGTGTLQRNPDIRWRLKHSALDKLQKLQLGLLRNASHYLKPGGLMLYGTCSLEEEENEAVILNFLAGNSDFFLDWPDGPNLREDFGSGKFLRLFPGETNSDGFFAALLRKPAASRLGEQTGQGS